MKKLRLNLEALQVESFTATEPMTTPGTVEGYRSERLCTGGDPYSCPCQPDYTYTEGYSCGGNSCIASCDVTCDPCDPSANEVYTCVYSCDYSCGDTCPDNVCP